MILILRNNSLLLSLMRERIIYN